MDLRPNIRELDVWRYALTADTEMNIFKMRAAGPGPGRAARILKMFISRGGFEGGDPLLNDIQWICLYLRGLGKVYMHFGGFPGFQGSGVFQPVAACGGLWRHSAPP